MNTRNEYFIKLNSARVWRTYLGGRSLDELAGVKNPQDGHFPEEWIMSVTWAFNAGRENLCEGLSFLADAAPPLSLKEVIEAVPEQMLGAEHTRRYGSNTGVLVKLIDAMERLTIQVHPNRRDAQRLFGSAFGKTECWHVLKGRNIHGRKPCIYLGFREGITREHWNRMFKEQNIDGMLACLHQFEASEGDTYLIEGGVPHAIGMGCFLAEIQEPTDYTLRVERITPAGLPVPDVMCHQGLGFEKMFDCFDYHGYSAKEVLRRWKLAPKIMKMGNGNIRTQLVGYEDTPFFKMEMLEILKDMMIDTHVFSGIYVIQGNGAFYCEDQNIAFSRGDKFFLPAHRKDTMIRAESTGKILRFYGPQNL